MVHGGAKVEDTAARIKEKGGNLVLIMFIVELMIGLRIGKARKIGSLKFTLLLIITGTLILYDGHDFIITLNFIIGTRIKRINRIFSDLIS
jgi:hypothetical protein